MNTEELITKIDKNAYLYKGDMTIEEWLDTRSDGLGGSDVGVIVGINPWTTPTRLFHEKLGTHPVPDLNKNDAIFWGRLNEENIRVTTEYWDHSDELEYTMHYLRGDKQFSHPEFPYFAMHEDFNHLRANVDALGYEDPSITQEDIVNRIKNGEQPCPDKIVEIKTIKGRARDRWKDGIPEGYKYQLMSYMLQFYHQNPNIYGEIYSLVDGSNLHCFKLEFNDEMAVEILEKTKEFWSRIEVAKDILEAKGHTEEAFKDIMDIEPDVDDSIDFSVLLSERELGKIQGNEKKVHSTRDFEEWRYKYKEISPKVSEMESMKRYYANEMKNFMRKNEASVVECDGGRVTFNKRIYVN